MKVVGLVYNTSNFTIGCIFCETGLAHVGSELSVKQKDMQC